MNTSFCLHFRACQPSQDEFPFALPSLYIFSAFKLSSSVNVEPSSRARRVFIPYHRNANNLRQIYRFFNLCPFGLARPTFGEPIASSERQFDVCVQHQRRRGLRVLPTRTNLF